MQQEIEKLQLQKQNLKEEKEVLEKREQALLQEKENLHLQNRKLIEDNEDLEKRWTSAKDNTNAKENEQLRKQIAKLQRDLQSLKNEEKTWKSSLENLSSTISEMDKEKGTLENKVNVYEKERKNWIKNSNLIHEVSSKKDQWKFRYQQSEENAERLKLLLSSKTTELERKVKEIDELQKANIYLAKTKDDLLTRLSKFAGAKLTHGNADITDLSDENRPVKIAEKFSELYDNEWTDALEEIMTKNISEKTAY
ncbi:hypothetical protein KUTeg_024212 [Tegillarca granosa]|uniref:Uncharacterized protein n=1 Tax=Tegillarca granosa TaxID=220873 RepID=A0ABQ9DWP0_TEGGR|nr:hypothetical protein KUTeg_024212 [Tegillarca granosa]